MNPDRVDASHFEMMKVVGKGGFGKVNAVRHRLTDQLMAMKRMKKSKLIKKKAYVITAWRERNIMAQLQSPFLVNLLYAFQDAYDLFVIMPFMQGGDLRYYLTTKGRMPESMVRFYAAEMILGLEELHSKHIVYRDLKPDNVLLDSQGHLRISDFGLGVILKKENSYKTKGTAGTAGYQAPEVIHKRSYGVSVDVWSLGVTLYELLTRDRPFHKEETFEQEQKIRFRDVELSKEAKDLVRKLLRFRPSDRLGCGSDGWDPVKHHTFFKGVDWDAFSRREATPPFTPEPDRAHCSPDHELQEQFFGDDRKKETPLTPDEQQQFATYEFNVDLKNKETKHPIITGPVDDNLEDVDLTIELIDRPDHSQKTAEPAAPLASWTSPSGGSAAAPPASSASSGPSSSASSGSSASSASSVSASSASLSAAPGVPVAAV